MILCKYPDHLMFIIDRNFFIPHRPFQCLGHITGGIGTNTGPPVIGVMVRLVPHKLAVTVMGKRDSQFHQLKKALTGQGCLAQRMLSIHTSALIQHLGQSADTVRGIPCQ